MSPKVKVAIAVSGKGRSLENLLVGNHPFVVSAVICSNPKAGAVEIAKRESLPLYDFNAKELDSKDLEAWLVDLGVEWVALAGFLKVFPTLQKFENRVVNIHPALLPKYGGHGMYGMRVHEAVKSAGENLSGATIHFVNDRYDEGAIISQGIVAIEPGLDSHGIAEKVFAMECRLYPETLSRLVTGELPLIDNQIWQIKDQSHA